MNGIYILRREFLFYQEVQRSQGKKQNTKKKPSSFPKEVEWGAL